MVSRRLKDLGDWGENLACAFLQRHGFFILERNYHCVGGEIDIVAKKEDDFYFVEVKTRHSKELATDLAITPLKKLKLEKAMRHYCYKRNLPETGLIMAGLLVMADKMSKKASLRFVVF